MKTCFVMAIDTISDLDRNNYTEYHAVALAVLVIADFAA